MRVPWPRESPSAMITAPVLVLSVPFKLQVVARFHCHLSYWPRRQRGRGMGPKALGLLRGHQEWSLHPAGRPPSA